MIRVLKTIPGRVTGVPEGTHIIVKSGEAKAADASGVVELRVAMPEAVHVVFWHPETHEHEVLEIPCDPGAELRGDGLTIDVPQDYAKLRLADYPDIGEQLDAIWKGGAEQEAMAKRIASTKGKFPKGLKHGAA